MIGAGSDTERKLISILKVLSESSEPLGSITIARELERHGVFLTELPILPERILEASFHDPVHRQR